MDRRNFLKLVAAVPAIGMVSSGGLLVPDKTSKEIMIPEGTDIALTSKAEWLNMAVGDTLQITFNSSVYSCERVGVFLASGRKLGDVSQQRRVVVCDNCKQENHRGG